MVTGDLGLPTPLQYPAPAAPSGTDRLAQLKKLGEPRDGGILTDAEIEVEKAKLFQG